MKSASALKSTKVDSPKTPGGISKSLLTPCRRVGLSRNFKKSAASPFQSPLSSVSSSSETRQQDEVSRKRQEPSNDILENPDRVIDIENLEVHTPTRNPELPRRKKSKTLLSAICDSTQVKNVSENCTVPITMNKQEDNEMFCSNNINEAPNKEIVSTPVRFKSKSRSKNKFSPKNITIEKATVSKEKNISMQTQNNISDIAELNAEQKNTPNDLTKECMVVLQKKMFKEVLNNKKINHCVNNKTRDKVSNLHNDSDSDDEPLIHLSNKEISKTTANNDEDDFETKPKINKMTKFPKICTKSPNLSKTKAISKVYTIAMTPSNSQNSDDDDFVEKKKTILVRKSYDKVVKPQKARSTGSITQKDIDELKSRIETKKKMLLARAMTEDTKELKDLIKKWQKGCQDALIELMDLMKNKLPDKQNMDYSEMLQALKIPASMVGYDSDNDCFLTPTDEDIVLAKFKD